MVSGQGQAGGNTRAAAPHRAVSENDRLQQGTMQQGDQQVNQTQAKVLVTGNFTSSVSNIVEKWRRQRFAREVSAAGIGPGKHAPAQPVAVVLDAEIYVVGVGPQAGGRHSGAASGLRNAPRTFGVSRSPQNVIKKTVNKSQAQRGYLAAVRRQQRQLLAEERRTKKKIQIAAREGGLQLNPTDHHGKGGGA